MQNDKNNQTKLKNKCIMCRDIFYRNVCIEIVEKIKMFMFHVMIVSFHYSMIQLKIRDKNYIDFKNRKQISRLWIILFDRDTHTRKKNKCFRRDVFRCNKCKKIWNLSDDIEKCFSKLSSIARESSWQFKILKFILNSS